MVHKRQPVRSTVYSQRSLNGVILCDFLWTWKLHFDLFLHNVALVHNLNNVTPLESSSTEMCVHTVHKFNPDIMYTCVTKVTLHVCTPLKCQTFKLKWINMIYNLQQNIPYIYCDEQSNGTCHGNKSEKTKTFIFCT